MYQKDNIFAKILKGTIPSETVYDNEWVYAFRDIHPAAPIHVLVIPKSSYQSFDDFTMSASPDELLGFWKSVHQITDLLKIRESGYRLITNHGADGNQSVPHFHVHIIAGRRLGGLVPGDAADR